MLTGVDEWGVLSKTYIVARGVNGLRRPPRLKYSKSKDKNHARSSHCSNPCDLSRRERPPHSHSGCLRFPRALLSSENRHPDGRLGAGSQERGRSAALWAFLNRCRPPLSPFSAGSELCVAPHPPLRGVSDVR